MKKYAGFCIILLLTAALLTGCKGEGDPTETEAVTTQSQPESSTTETSEPESTTQAVPEDPAKPRVMLKWNQKTILGDTRILQAGGFEDVKITRSDDSRDAETPASLTFSLVKKLGTEGELAISGSLLVVKDATFLFDIPVEESEETYDETEDTQQEAIEEDRDEIQTFTPEEAGVILAQLMGNILEETEKGAKLESVQAQGISWNFGAAAADNDNSGNTVLNFCAAGTGDGVLLYLNAGALIRGEADAKPVVDRIKEDMTAWMQSLCFADAQGSLLGGDDPMRIPFAGKTLVTYAADYLRIPGAEVGFAGSDYYLNAYLSGSLEADDSESILNARLKNKNAMTPEELALMENLAGETLKGRGLDWVVSQTESEGESMLLAKTQAEGQDICFMFNIINTGEGAAKGSAEILDQARNWLAELYLQ